MFFHLETGALHRNHLVTSDASLVPLNTPDGHGAIDVVDGRRFDHLSQRVDLELLKADDDAAATAWAAVKDANRLARTAGGDPGEDPPPPPRTVPSVKHVVDYQPPQPSADHEWNPARKRWQLTAAARDLESQKRAAAAEVVTLRERRHDLVSRLALDPTDAAARKELLDIQARIAALSNPEGH
jgi:hypothetical protein